MTPVDDRLVEFDTEISLVPCMFRRRFAEILLPYDYCIFPPLDVLFVRSRCLSS